MNHEVTGPVVTEDGTVGLSPPSPPVLSPSASSSSFRVKTWCPAPGRPQAVGPVHRNVETTLQPPVWYTGGKETEEKDPTSTLLVGGGLGLGF